jgi:hypothetical protein
MKLCSASKKNKDCQIEAKILIEGRIVICHWKENI